MKIPDDVMDVLKRSTITATSVALPAGQLDRKLYEGVNRVLTDAGGKWNRSAKAHLFTGDPRQKLGLAMESGESVNEKQKFQAFFTPKHLAEMMAERAGVSGRSVLEPSAGHGAIADECWAAGAKRILCIELNPESVAVLESKGYGIIAGDFLAITPVPFDCIVMNPPFTKNQDIKHVSHALQFLAPGGTLVAVMAGNQSRKFFENIPLPHEIEELPEGTFKESGTMVRTLLLTIRKP